MVYTCGALLTTRLAVTLAVVTAVVEIGGYALLSLPPLENPVADLTAIAVHLALSLLLYVGAALLGAHITMRRRYAEMVVARVDADALAARVARETAERETEILRADAD